MGQQVLGFAAVGQGVQRCEVLGLGVVLRWWVRHLGLWCRGQGWQVW